MNLPNQNINIIKEEICENVLELINFKLYLDLVFKNDLLPQSILDIESIIKNKSINKSRYKKRKLL